MRLEYNENQENNLYENEVEKSCLEIELQSLQSNAK